MARINRKRWVVGQYIQTVGRVNEGGGKKEKGKAQKPHHVCICFWRTYLCYANENLQRSIKVYSRPPEWV